MTMREALELAANRMDRAVLDLPFGSRERSRLSEWAQEARAVLYTPATGGVPDDAAFAAQVASADSQIENGTALRVYDIDSDEGLGKQLRPLSETLSAFDLISHEFRKAHQQALASVRPTSAPPPVSAPDAAVMPEGAPDRVWIHKGEERFPEDDTWTDKPGGLDGPAYIREDLAFPSVYAPVGEEARQLAEVVLSMQFASAPGQHARSLARRVLGLRDPHGASDETVAITTNGTTRFVPKGEPVFLVRGQDAAGAATVRAWAAMAEDGGAVPEIIEKARAQADLMEAWPIKKTADLPAGWHATPLRSRPCPSVGVKVAMDALQTAILATAGHSGDSYRRRAFKDLEKVISALTPSPKGEKPSGHADWFDGQHGSLPWAFDLGYAWRGMLTGQVLEDSRAVGRTLSADIFKGLPLDLDVVPSFETADNGICTAKAEIKRVLSALAPKGVDAVETLVGALEFYADVSKYPAPFTGGMGALWKDCGERARAAIKAAGFDIARKTDERPC